jgi:hypothetical protein
MPCYKYVLPDLFEKCFDDENFYLRASQPSSLNDPFELNPVFDDYPEDEKTKIKSQIEQMRTQFKDIPDIDKEIEEIEKKKFKELSDFAFRTSDENNGIVSLSKNGYSPTMWAYYTDNNKGFLVELRKEFSIALEGKLKPVKYEKIRPRNMYDERLIESAYIKGDHWSHEQEWRMVVKTTDMAYTNTHEGLPVYLEKIPLRFVSRIVLGLKMDEKMKQKIIHWSNQLDHPIPIYQAFVCSKSYSYDYKII